MSHGNNHLCKSLADALVVEVRIRSAHREILFGIFLTFCSHRVSTPAFSLHLRSPPDYLTLYLNFLSSDNFVKPLPFFFSSLNASLVPHTSRFFRFTFYFPFNNELVSLLFFFFLKHPPLKGATSFYRTRTANTRSIIPFPSYPFFRLFFKRFK